MSRSRRKTPKAAITSTESDKPWKQFASRRVRRWVDAHVNPQEATAADFDLVNYEEHPRSGQWTFGKDGKVWLGEASILDRRKWLRK